jgi:hypothetical protein
MTERLVRRLSRGWGRVQYLRGKSQWTIETIRSWVMPGSAAGAFVKYVGLPTEWALAVAILVPLSVEVFGFFLGRFLWEGGGVEAEYTLALQKDPYRVESLAAFKAMERTLAEIERRQAEHLAWLQRLMMSPPLDDTPDDP